MNASALNLGLSVAAIAALLCVGVGVAILSRKLPMPRRSTPSCSLRMRNARTR